MKVTLQGSSPSTITAGIMLLTRARQLGFTLSVAIQGDPDDLTTILGPGVVYAPVLASCGVGREHGSGATVVLPGPPGHPILASLTPHGVDGWFQVDRSGEGVHPATQAFVRLSRDPRPKARAMGAAVRGALQTLGVRPEPAVLDVLFGAPVPPLLRLAVALRAGRAMGGGRGEAITRYLAGSIADAQDPIDGFMDPETLIAWLQAQEHHWVLSRLNTSLRDPAETFLANALDLAEEDNGRDLALVSGLVEIVSHLAQLPQHSILPPLGAAEDSVAVALAAALGADGDACANKQLAQVFRFLGGQFVNEGDHPLLVSSEPHPAHGDDAERWHWFSSEVRRGRKWADAMWNELWDPAS